MALYSRLDGDEWVIPQQLPTWWKGIDLNLDQLNDEALRAIGWYRWVDAQDPEHDPDTQVLSKIRTIVDGNLTWQFAIRDMTEEERASHLARIISQKVVEIETIRDQKLEIGFSFDFGPPYGVQILQTRSIDLIPWLSTDSAAKTLIMAGQPNAQLVMRTKTNTNIMVPAMNVVQILIAMQGFISSIYVASWVHKDTVRAISTPATVRAHDATIGWPI